MKLSLYQRLSLSLLAVFIAIFLVFYYWAQQLELQARYESEQHLHLKLAENLARDNPLLKQGVYDYDALKNLFNTLMVLGPAFEFYMLDPDGNILTHSIKPELIKREKVDVKPLLAIIEGQEALPIYGDDPKNASRQKVFSAAPVYNKDRLQGYLYVIVAGEHYESAYNRPQLSHQAKLSLMLLVAAIVFLFAVMLGLFAYFTKPLRLLNKDMRKLKEAGFDTSKVELTRWQKNSYNEVHLLGDVFQQMAIQIHLQLKQLKEADVNRRELLADISHDLRTPLAALQGYIETLSLGADKLSPKEQQACIETSLKNAKQLKQLIDQIFELAHLEGGQVSLNLENFNLAELLYDVIAKFSLTAKQKHVNIAIDPASSGVVIYSDIAKLERVLTNLIENAIRHTPSGGDITLVINEMSSSRCQLTVKDTGTGIKQEELSYIFDTRYRASNAITEGGKHTGLGLAITRKLLEVLQTEIRVKSALGKGTEFSFTLDKGELSGV